MPLADDGFVGFSPSAGSILTGFPSLSFEIRSKSPPLLATLLTVGSEPLGESAACSPGSLPEVFALVSASESLEKSASRSHALVLVAGAGPVSGFFSLSAPASGELAVGERVASSVRVSSSADFPRSPELGVDTALKVGGFIGGAPITPIGSAGAKGTVFSTNVNPFDLQNW